MSESEYIEAECSTCGKTWRMHSVYCPASPVKLDHKWSKCVCFDHTCFQRQPTPPERGG